MPDLPAADPALTNAMAVLIRESSLLRLRGVWGHGYICRAQYTLHGPDSEFDLDFVFNGTELAQRYVSPFTTWLPQLVPPAFQAYRFSLSGIWRSQRIDGEVHPSADITAQPLMLRLLGDLWPRVVAHEPVGIYETGPLDQLVRQLRDDFWTAQPVEFLSDPTVRFLTDLHTSTRVVLQRTVNGRRIRLTLKRSDQARTWYIADIEADDRASEHAVGQLVSTAGPLRGTYPEGLRSDLVGDLLGLALTLTASER